jgi:hypothetical protein
VAEPELWEVDEEFSPAEPQEEITPTPRDAAIIDAE